MKNLYKAEFYKILHSRTEKSVIFFVFLYLIVIIGQQKDMIKIIHIFSIYERNIFSVFPFASIYGIVIAHDHISGYIKDLIFVGFSRKQIYWGRYFSFLFGFALCLLLPLVLLAIYFFIKDGVGEFLYFFDVEFLKNVCLFLVYIICFSSFLMMIIMLLKTYASVVFFCISYNIAFVVIHEIIPSNMLWVPVQYSIVGISEKIFSVKELSEWLVMMGSLLGRTLLFLEMGYIFFLKRELR